MPRRCMEEGCTTAPTYGVPGTRSRTYCARHGKARGLVCLHVASKRKRGMQGGSSKAPRHGPTETPNPNSTASSRRRPRRPHGPQPTEPPWVALSRTEWQALASNAASIAGVIVAAAQAPPHQHPPAVIGSLVEHHVGRFLSTLAAARHTQPRRGAGAVLDEELASAKLTSTRIFHEQA